MVLVVGAGLFARTLMRLQGEGLGFQSHNLLLFNVQLPETRYPKAASTEVLQRLEERMKTVPGAESATLSYVPLISGNAMNNTFLPEGMQRKAEGNPSVLANEVGADFFSTYGIGIVAGRGLAARDTNTSRKVAVINESLATKYFANVNPIGRTFERGRNHPDTIEIVGVCADAKYYRVREDAEPTFYTPYLQDDNGMHNATFAIRTSLAGEAILPTLREAVRQVDPSLPMLDVRTQDEQVASNLRQERIFAMLTSGFGVLALVLACVGVYGVMAYSVARRTSEIGIRLALGAPRTRVLTMVLREASWLGIIGTGAGLAAALLLARLVKSMLYGISPNDPVTIAGGMTLLLGAALVAGWIPARRAAGV